MAGKFQNQKHGADSAVTAEINAGVRLQMQGDFCGAEAAYRKVLQQHPDDAGALLYLGVLQLQRGFHAQAEELLARAHAGGADSLVYYINAGLCALHLGDPHKAEALLRTAVERAPDRPEAHFNFASALYALKRYEEAAEAFARADKLSPDDLRASFHLGCALQDARRYEEALPPLQRVLQKEPRNSRANMAYALSLLRLYRAQEAMPYALLAREADPQNPVICYNCGHILRALGRLSEAREAYEAALRVDPECIEALTGLGRLLTEAGQAEEGEALIERALAKNPESYSGCLSRGVGLMRRDAQEALVWFDKALAIRPEADDARMYKGYVLGQLGRSGEAEVCLREAIWLAPRQAECHQNLANVLLAQGRVGECLEANREAFTINPRNQLVFSNILLYSHYLTQTNRDDLWHLHQNYDRMYRAQMQIGPVPGFANARDPGKRLRVGLVSADFRRHSCAYFLFPLLHGYDRSKLEVIAYCSVKAKDRFTESLLGLCDASRDILNLTDEQAAGLIYRDRVDVLIDLGGHTADNRLPVFLHKPAPVQVAWLGYPDTTGLTTMDYRITDFYADPQGSEAFSSEKLVRLQGGFHCYAQTPDLPPVGPLPADAAGTITFGSFNNYAKVSAETVFLWSETLKHTPGSRLLLKSLGLDDPATQTLIRERFAKVGIAPERLELVGRTQRADEHLGLYHRVDIALDTYPYNGTTTTFEALLMGVPVVTLGGATHASLVGRSLLTNCGMGELSCREPGEYINKAVSLAKDRGLLRSLRGVLREKLGKSPLMDEAGFCRKFEDAMRVVWGRFCAASPVPAQVAFRTEAGDFLRTGDVSAAEAPIPRMEEAPGMEQGAREQGVPVLSAGLRLDFGAGPVAREDTGGSAAPELGVLHF